MPDMLFPLQWDSCTMIGLLCPGITPGEYWHVCQCPPLRALLAPTPARNGKLSATWGDMALYLVYYSAMTHIIPEINKKCSKNGYYWFKFADKLVLQSRSFWHLLCMDGAEIAAATIMNHMWHR